MYIAHYVTHFKQRFDLVINTSSDDNADDARNVIDGWLVSRTNPSTRYRIRDAVPRFNELESKNYADNFGLQWNRFRKTQFDSETGLPLTADRFWTNTRWTKEGLRGKLVLEVGCGAGRFTEIIQAAGAQVVSFDLSNAVDANYANSGSHSNVLLFQGDIFNIPFPDDHFDFVFCYGVLQHTPDPDAAYNSILAKLKKGGKMSIDYYLAIEGLSPWSTPKYRWRPITTRLPPKLLLRIIQAYMPLWLPIDTLLRRIPLIGYRLVAGLSIPCWNYLGFGLTYRQRLQWAILDTFDALAPLYDLPKTLPQVQKMIHRASNASEEVFLGSNGVVANVTK